MSEPHFGVVGVVRRPTRVGFSFTASSLRDFVLTSMFSIGELLCRRGEPRENRMRNTFYVPGVQEGGQGRANPAVPQLPT